MEFSFNRLLLWWYIFIAAPWSRSAEVLGAPGTTQNIEQIFIGRCEEYKDLPGRRLYTQKVEDCSNLWELFVNAFAYKDPADVRQSYYQEFFDVAKPTDITANKAILWSGTNIIAHEYSERGTRYITLEDSLIGYLVNGLTWCGITCTSCDGINYKECPDWLDIPEEARVAFWGGASSTFAGAVRGEVKILLNSSNPESPAYRSTSFFGLFELQSLPKDAIPVVVLLHDLDIQPVIETCDSGSLVVLKERLQKSGFPWNCFENPADLVHLMCVDDSTKEICSLEQYSAENSEHLLSNVILGNGKLLAG